MELFHKTVTISKKLKLCSKQVKLMIWILLSREAQPSYHIVFQEFPRLPYTFSELERVEELVDSSNLKSMPTK